MKCIVNVGLVTRMWPSRCVVFYIISLARGRSLEGALMQNGTDAAIRSKLEFTKKDAPADSVVCLHALLCWIDWLWIYPNQVMPQTWPQNLVQFLRFLAGYECFELIWHTLRKLYSRSQPLQSRHLVGLECARLHRTSGYMPSYIAPSFDK